MVEQEADYPTNCPGIAFHADRTGDAIAIIQAEAKRMADDGPTADELAKAKSYQDNMAMSPEAIRDQLTSEYGEKFTAEEADYAIQHLND